MIKITQKEIKNKALELFLNKGYNNVTILDICKELNITKPTFYKYVNSKEELILDLYDSTIDIILSDPYQFIEVDTHYEQLLIVFKRLIEETTKYGSNLFSQMIISNLNENRHSIDMRPQLTKLCTTIIEKAQNKKEILNLSNPANLYAAIAYAFSGYELAWCIQQGNLDWNKQFFITLRDILNVREDLKNIHEVYL